MLHFLLCVVLLCLSSSDAGKTCGRQLNFASPRIIGGEDVTSIDEFPWSVSIQIRDSGAWWQECGGSFLTDRLIITAAHCANNGYVPYRAVFGCANVTSPDCQIIYFSYEDWILHDDYKDEDGIKKEIGDIGLIKLPVKANYSLETGKAVGSVCLPRRIRDYHGQEVTAIGYGLTHSPSDEKEIYSDILQKYTAKVIDLALCRKTVVPPLDVNFPPQYHLCTSRGIPNNDGVCNGDSGGPLMVRSKSGQMVVIGLAIDTAPDCVSGPVLYTRVDHYLDWIMDIFRKEFWSLTNRSSVRKSRLTWVSLKMDVELRVRLSPSSLFKHIMNITKTRYLTLGSEIS